MNRFTGTWRELSYKLADLSEWLRHAWADTATESKDTDDEPVWSLVVPKHRKLIPDADTADDPEETEPDPLRSWFPEELPPVGMVALTDRFYPLEEGYPTRIYEHGIGDTKTCWRCLRSIILLFEGQMPTWKPLDPTSAGDLYQRDDCPRRPGSACTPYPPDK